MSTAQVNGHRLYYEDSGRDGPVVALSHGFLMDHEMFAPQLGALTGGYRVITRDERGHRATRAGGPFDYWDLADDLLALLDHLEVRRAVLGGMPQGGFLSLRAALRAPDRVRALILIDSQAGLERPEAMPAFDAMHEDRLATGPANIANAAAAAVLGPGCDPTPWLDKWQDVPRADLTPTYRCLMDRDDITARLGGIVALGLIFHGDQDIAIPLERAEVLRDGLGGRTEFVIVPGAGHAANLARPDIVNRAILEFLDSLD